MYEVIARNRRMSVVYVGLFFVFWAGVGALAGWLVVLFSEGRAAPGTTDPAGGALTGLVVALIISIGVALVVLTFGSRLVLQAAGAHPAHPQRDAALINLVEALAIGTGLPTPEVYVIEDPSPNAFATGSSPKKAAITVTRGLLQMMTQEELEGVLAHEMSHIKNYDVRLLLVVTQLIGLAGLLASIAFRSMFWARVGRGRGNAQVMIVVIVVALALAIFAFVLGPLVKLALSRRRELLADSSGVELTRNPAGLLSALRKLQGVNQPFRKFNAGTAAMCIVDPTQHPTAKAGGWFARLYDTHPPMAQRIANLEALMLGGPPGGSSGTRE